MHFRRIKKQFNFNDADIIATDKTPVWNDMVSNTTVEKTGSKEVPMKSSGDDKVHVSVCLTGKADGTRLAKRESTALHEEFHRQCSVASSANGWMTEELTLRWCNEILGQFSFRKRLLAWDSYEAHLTDNVKKALTKSKIETAIVPGGCTYVFRGLRVTNLPKYPKQSFFSRYLIHGYLQSQNNLH